MVGIVDLEAARDGAEAPNGPPGNAVESSGKLWSVCLAESERHDRALAENWKAEMDGLLIFAGLFSAVVTAFLVGSLQQMTQPNQTPGTTSTSAPENSSSLLRVNALWCSSLLSSLLSALCATLVQQWARQYTQALGRRAAPHQRARVRAFLLQGIERSGVKAVVEGAPALLHLAMFLFVAGLIDIIAPASRMLSLLSSGVLVVITAFYLVLSWFPLHDLQSPYYTPLSSVLWYIKQAVRPLRFTSVEGWPVIVDSRSLSRGREQYASATRDGTQDRDLASLSWALSSLIDRGNCEPFIEGIAGFMHSNMVVGAPVIMHELIKRKDLARHISELLVNCVEPAHDSIDVRRRQSISGLSALRALATNWFSGDTGVTLQEGDPHGIWKWSYSFPVKAIDATMSLRSVSDSMISMHARCTAAVAVWRLLVDYDELGAYTKQKLVTVERLLAYLESTRDEGRGSGQRARVRDKIKKIDHDLLAVWAQSTQTHIETLRMNSPQPDSKRAQKWDTEKADLKMMRYLWEQNMCPPEAWLDDDIELRHNETDNGESSMLDSVLAYLSLHAKLLHRTLKPLGPTQLPLSAYVDDATECLDQWDSAAMKELMPRIIASGHVANVIQLIKHAIKGPRRSDADQVMILETLETIAAPIRTLQGKLDERGQRSLLGLLKFLKERHLDVMFRDIDNLTGSVYQFIVKIGEKIIPLAVRGLETPDLWQPAQSTLMEYEDICPDLANTLSRDQMWIKGKLLHYQFSAAQPSPNPLLLPPPSESHGSLAVFTTHPRQPLSKSAVPSPRLFGPASPRNSTAKSLEIDLFQLIRSDGRRNAHKIVRPLHSHSGHFQEPYIDVPVESEQGEFIDMVQDLQEPAARGRRDSTGSSAAGRPRDVAPTPTSWPPSPSSSSRGGWAEPWKLCGSAPMSSTSTRPASSPPSPNRRKSARFLAVQMPHDGAAPPSRPPSLPPLSLPSNSSAGDEFALVPMFELFVQSTSLQTTTAETEPGQDTSTKFVASLPVQIREGEGSPSRLHPSRTLSPKSLVPAAIPPSPQRDFAPRFPPPATPPERSYSSSLHNSGRPSWPSTPLPTIAGNGLGLYIPQQSHSGPLPLSTPGRRFHTPVNESVEPGVVTHAYPSNPAASASALTSTPTSASASTSAAAPSGRLASTPTRGSCTDGQENREERILPSLPSRVSDDVGTGNDNTGSGGGVKFGSRADSEVGDTVKAPRGRTDSRTRSASEGSNDSNGVSKRASRDADELQPNSGLLGVTINRPPPSPHESRNPDAGIVARPSTSNRRPLRVTRNADTDTNAAHIPKQEPDTDTPSSSLAEALDPSL